MQLKLSSFLRRVGVSEWEHRLSVVDPICPFGLEPDFAEQIHPFLYRTGTCKGDPPLFDICNEQCKVSSASN